MNIFNKLVLFIGIAKFEAKRGAGQDVFEKILSKLSKPLEETDDAQIVCFKSVLVPLLSEENIANLKVYLNWMIDLHRPEASLSATEEQFHSKWERIYRLYLDALPE